MSENPIVAKSFAFALRIVKLSRYLADEYKEFTLSRELLVAGTNIGKHVKRLSAANRLKRLRCLWQRPCDVRMRRNIGCS